MVTPKELGERLSALRHEKKLTQRQLAEQLHVTDKAISRWERGIGYPDFQILGELCRVLGLSVDELLYGSKETAPQTAPNPTASAEAPERREPSASEKPLIQQASLAAVYAEAEAAYRKRRRKRLRAAALVLLLLLCVALAYRAHFQPRVRRTLEGSWTTQAGEVVPVRVELDGRLYRFLFKRELYYGGSFVIASAEDGAELLSVSFVAKDHAEGSDVIGLLSEYEDVWRGSSFIYLPEANKFGILRFVVSKDFSKLWISRNDAMPGELAAAVDPDVDLERFRARYVSLQ